MSLPQVLAGSARAPLAGERDGARRTLVPAFVGTLLLASTAAGQETKLVPPDGVAFDRFGSAIATTGTTAAFGAPHDELGALDGVPGTAYVYVRGNDGDWVLQQQMSPGAVGNNDHFGFSISLDGELLVVGAPNDSEAGTTSEGLGEGAVHVYHFESGTWAHEAKLLPPIPGKGRFGWSVDLSDDVLVVGQRYYAAFLYRREAPGTWVQEEGSPFVHDGKADGEFGESVAIFQDHVLVGASEAFTSPVGHGGVVYPIRRTPTGWVEDPKIETPYPENATGHFGAALDIYGRFAVVGAYGMSYGPGLTQGKVFVYRLNASGAWDAHQELVASDADSGDGFGYSLAIGNGGIVCGAPFKGAGDTGAAYEFELLDGTWTQSAVFQPNPAQEGDWLGHAVAIGGFVIAGAPRDDETAGGGPQVNVGSAYVLSAD